MRLRSSRALWLIMRVRLSWGGELFHGKDIVNVLTEEGGLACGNDAACRDRTEMEDEAETGLFGGLEVGQLAQALGDLGGGHGLGLPIGEQPVAQILVDAALVALDDFLATGEPLAGDEGEGVGTVGGDQLGGTDDVGDKQITINGTNVEDGLDVQGLVEAGLGS